VVVRRCSIFLSPRNRIKTTEFVPRKLQTIYSNCFMEQIKIGQIWEKMLKLCRSIGIFLLARIQLVTSSDSHDAEHFTVCRRRRRR